MLVIVLCGLTARAWRQTRLNHDLIAAVKRNDIDRVLACLERRADPNACDNAQPASVWELLRTQFLRQKPLHQGTAALLIAANSGQDTQAVVHTLLAHGANPDPRSVEGLTPLLFAAYRGRVGIMKMLIEQGADVQARDKLGATALHCTAATMTQGTRLLLDNHAAMDARNNAGQTPLMFEAEAGNIEDVRLMISRGANVHVLDTSNHTALWYANQHNERDVARMLRRAEAKR